MELVQVLKSKVKKFRVDTSKNKKQAQLSVSGDVTCENNVFYFKIKSAIAVTPHLFNLKWLINSTSFKCSTICQYNFGYLH